MQLHVLKKGGERLGVLDGEQILEMLTSGQLGWDDLCWKEGMAEWVALHAVLERPAHVPPPPPSARAVPPPPPVSAIPSPPLAPPPPRRSIPMPPPRTTSQGQARPIPSPPQPAPLSGQADQKLLPYPLKKIRASLIGGAVLSGLWTLSLFLMFFGPAAGGILGLLAVIGSPVATYRGCLGNRLGKGITALLTIVSFFPPIGLVAHIVLLSRLPRT